MEDAVAVAVVGQRDEAGERHSRRWPFATESVIGLPSGSVAITAWSNGWPAVSVMSAIGVTTGAWLTIETVIGHGDAGRERAAGAVVGRGEDDVVRPVLVIGRASS